MSGIEISKKTDFICPHCNTKQAISSNTFENQYSSILIYCDVEVGGCDALLVAKPKIEFSVEIFTVNEEKR